MFLKTQTIKYTVNYSTQIERLKQALNEADAVVIGAGAGLSTSAGHTYTGDRFEKNFPDFIAKYHLSDMYSAGFYPFPSPEEQWAYWSRHILLNRYTTVEKETEVFKNLLRLVKNKDYFVLTTNVDHCFHKAGFDKKRLFYTQGDYGLWQCSEPCCQKTYDNEAAVRQMVAEQMDMRIPSALVPRCPICGKPMAMNLRKDDRFVEDEGWHEHAALYESFIRKHMDAKVLYLELGVGGNTPGIIKYPFWRLTRGNAKAIYACIN
ncbi:MAG: Sir2 silent information regulator family NAD-dependent deacetylase, partial [Selenomonadaceae bacterium]